ncbi:MAG: putative glycoside hydrolase [Candidatus Aminicenantales bacterium]
MKKSCLLLATFFSLIVVSGQAQEIWEGRGVWAHPGDFGKTEKEVEAFFALLKRCNIQIVVPLVKDTAGQIFWHSRRFPEAVHPDYREFDLLRAITNIAPKYQIKVHAWLCDFPEGKDSPAFKLHPEWAMRNPQGGVTSEEKVTAEQPYEPVWMCPAQRPGYTDQWLLPMIEEVVRQYPVDGIHHDYVRYPGDVAPDSYCFCDYCLENFLNYNFFYYPSRPNVQVPLKSIRLRPESNWDQDFTVKPSNWAQMSREEKAKFILEGASINRSDLDYFFYEMRCDAISRFVREAWELTSKIRPAIEMSAAVFINPMKSGRFIGQRWTDFLPWLDITMPMTYRSHFQGSFEDYLTYLGDTVRAQIEWVGERSTLLVGLDAHYIFKEELEPWERAVKLLKTPGQAESEKELASLIQADIVYLTKFSVPRAQELRVQFERFQKKKVSREALTEELNRILADAPPGFFPEEKLIRTIEVVREAKGQGVVIFAASHLTKKKLWGALEKAFSFPAGPAHEKPSEQNFLSIRTWGGRKK